MQHAERFLRKRKFLLFLPVIVWPFVALIFWLLGGGSGANASNGNSRQGLNMQLPDAKLDKLSVYDKLSFYAMADKDSVRRVELQKMDPNLKEQVEEVEVVDTKARLERVTREVYRPAPQKIEHSSDLEDLQEMVKRLQQQKTDPDMDVLNGTLKQLVELQRPAVAMTTSESRKVLEVRATGETTGGFFGETGVVTDTVAGMIRAVVHGEQTLQNGSVVKLRLLTDVVIKGNTVPAGTFVFGSTAFGNERMTILIPAINYQGALYPVALSVFDLDGMEGIYIPGSTAREIFKQSADQGIQSVGSLSIDQSLKAQAAAAGIGAAKLLLSRKARQVRVTIKSGYQVLLRDEKSRDQ